MFNLYHIRKHFKERGCVLLETEWTPGKKLRFLCYCGEIRKITYSYFRRGYCCKCKKIKKTRAEIHKKLISRGKGYGDWREKVLLKDEYTCQKCGRNLISYPFLLRAHHIQELHNHPELKLDVNNGGTLCVDCHILFHELYGTDELEKYMWKEFIHEKN